MPRMFSRGASGLMKSKRRYGLDCPFCAGSGWRIVEQDGVSGAERCPCGTVPLPSGRAVPYRKVRREKGDGLAQVKIDWIQ